MTRSLSAPKYRWRILLATAAAVAMVAGLARPSSALVPDVITDTTVTDFNAGTQSNTLVQGTTDGSVSLMGPADSDFTSGLPAGWTTTKWDASGTSSVSSGKLVVNGSSLISEHQFVAGQRMTTLAKFIASSNQAVGFTQSFAGSDASEPQFRASPDGSLYAWVNGSNYQAITGATFGVFNTYRIDWFATRAEFYINGTAVAQLNFTYEPYTRSDSRSAVLRPGFTDFVSGGSNLQVDSVRVEPLESGVSANFNGSSLDSNWTWTPFYGSWCCTTLGSYSVGGGQVSMDGGHVSSDFMLTAGQKLEANATFESGDDFQMLGFTHEWENEDPMPSFETRIDGATLYAWVNSSNYVDLGTGYFGSEHTYRVDWYATRAVFFIDGSQVANIPFVVQPYSQADMSQPVLRASAGEAPVDGTFFHVNSMNVTSLQGSLDTDFNGTTIPNGWTDWAYNGTSDSSTVSGGKLTLGDTHVSSDVPIPAGSRMDVVAKFTGMPYQGIGFTRNWGGDDPQPYFETLGGGHLYAYATPGNYVEIPGTWFTAYHTYRIDWSATKAQYYIDGSLKATLTFSSTGVLRPSVTDSTVSTTPMTVDSIRMYSLPTTGTGTFTSRVIDAESVVDWKQFNASLSTPSGTSVALSYRTGNTATPGTGWTSFVNVTPGAAISVSSRYIQYKAVLARSASGAESALNDVSLLRHINVVHTTESQFDSGSFTDTESVATGDGAVALLTGSNSGTFTSPVVDSPDAKTWTSVSWNADKPSDSAVVVRVRGGNSATPDGTWSSYSTISSGGPAPTGMRYLQYDVQFTRATTGETPSLNDVTLRS